jgi:hypothetical protein
MRRVQIAVLIWDDLEQAKAAYDEGLRSCPELEAILEHEHQCVPGCVINAHMSEDVIASRALFLDAPAGMRQSEGHRAGRGSRWYESHWTSLEFSPYHHGHGVARLKN